MPGAATTSPFSRPRALPQWSQSTLWREGRKRSWRPSSRFCKSFRRFINGRPKAQQKGGGAGWGTKARRIRIRGRNRTSRNRSKMRKSRAGNNPKRLLEHPLLMAILARPESVPVMAGGVAPLDPGLGCAAMSAASSGSGWGSWQLVHSGCAFAPTSPFPPPHFCRQCNSGPHPHPRRDAWGSILRGSRHRHESFRMEAT